MLKVERLQDQIPAAWLSCTDLYYARGSQGVLPMRVGGAISQFYLPSAIDVESLKLFSLAYYIVNWFNSSRYELTRA